MKLIASSDTPEGLAGALNKYHYSTTYKVENGEVTFKPLNLPRKKNEHIAVKVKRGRYFAYHI